MTASGQAGGLLCVYDADGRVRFREHTDESAPTAYGELPSTPSGPAPARFRGDKVKPTLAVAPDGRTLDADADGCGRHDEGAALPG